MVQIPTAGIQREALDVPARLAIRILLFPMVVLTSTNVMLSPWDTNTAGKISKHNEPKSRGEIGKEIVVRKLTTSLSAYYRSVGTVG